MNEKTSTSHLKALEQTKLNVTKKTRSNMFNWRGQFTPEFVEYILDSFISATDTTFDPFCGSGTVLLESARRNVDSIGYEINPAAYAMARFVTLSEISEQERHALSETVAARIESLVGTYHDIPLFQSHPAYRDSHRSFLKFAKELLSQIEHKNEMILALNFLFRLEKSGNGNLVDAARRSFNIVKKHLLGLPYTSASLTAELCDARLSHQKLRCNVDVILTSPPYINVFNYHQNYRAIIELLGFNVLKVAASEIGSNRKNRSNRFRTVIQYALEMEQALQSFYYSLRAGGLLILIVGRESRVRGVPFYNSKILLYIANCLQCYRQEMSNERVFVNRFGKRIIEDILIFRKTDKIPQSGQARNVANAQLERAYGEGGATLLMISPTLFHL